jgi:aspartate/methionine/tyrosine aminotransferase
MSKHYPSLSERGNSLATNPARIDFELFMEASQNLYCPKTNPTGAFPLNVAENQLMASAVKKQLTSIVQQNEAPDWVMGYTHFLGNPEVRVEISKFMEQHLCKCPISPDSIGLSAGASAIIEASSFVLTNPGDVVVIPAPSYPMYTKDLGLKNGISRYDLQTHYNIEEIGSEAPVTTELLDKTLADLNKQEKCFKILLITSPDNPTGCMYSEQELKQLADWCIQHQIHLIVNEIYGLSLIDTEDKELQEDYHGNGTYASFAQIMDQQQSNYLHLWYAFSKDFAMSGLRVGIVHSLNEAFMTAFGNVNIPHLVSNFTQWMVAEMLKDTAFIEHYIQENKKQLNKSYKLTVATLKKLNIPYLPSRGSFFVWADFSQYFQENSNQAQEQLWVDIYKNTGILLTPGMGFQHQKKGLFRLVYTAVPFSHLEVAMDRISNYLLNRD